jgi:hypothetical protein
MDFPFDYTNQPLPSNRINIDDIINALQSTRNDTYKLEEEIKTLNEFKPKPIDLNQGNTYYVVAHKIFASGQVWEPDTPLLQDERRAQFELFRLSRMSNCEYKIHKLKWCTDDEISGEETKISATDNNIPTDESCIV